jgi:hypothetical protein
MQLGSEVIPLCAAALVLLSLAVSWKLAGKLDLAWERLNRD